MVKFGKILDIIKKMPDFTLMNSVTCSEEDTLVILLAKQGAIANIGGNPISLRANNLLLIWVFEISRHF